MEHKVCLNCSEGVTNRFCPNCGQRTDLHRISFKHLMTHDLLHGVWHLERGILFTVKEAIVRPGQAALDYIGGKRIRYYNVFYLSLLLLALNVLLSHFYDGILYENPAKNAEESSEFYKVLSENIKIVILGIVPVIAVSGWIVFRRLKLNLAEHLIIGGISLLGILISALPLLFVKFLEEYQSVQIGILKILFVLPVLFYPIWTYANATKNVYSGAARIWRLILFYFLILLQILLGLMAIVYAFTSQSDLEINV